MAGVTAPTPDPATGTASGSGTANPPLPTGGGSPLAKQLTHDIEYPASASGIGQVIGITSFSGFDMADVENWLTLMGIDSTRINQLSGVVQRDDQRRGGHHQQQLCLL